MGRIAGVWGRPGRFILALSLLTPPAVAAPDPVSLVNPLMGTDSSRDLSYGNTYPAVSVPWGMNAWTPQTGKMGDGWAYTYDAEKIRGIKLTHQPSPWMNDYAAFSLFAETGALKVDEIVRASWFSHKAEVSALHRYKVYLADYDVTAEVALTARAAQFRFTFPESGLSHILLDAFDGGSGVRIDRARRRISGYARNNHESVPANFHSWFVAEFRQAVRAGNDLGRNGRNGGVHVTRRQACRRGRQFRDPARRGGARAHCLLLHQRGAGGLEPRPGTGRRRFRADRGQSAGSLSERVRPLPHRGSRPGRAANFLFVPVPDAPFSPADPRGRRRRQDRSLQPI